jgi:hypothetical protein
MRTELAHVFNWSLIRAYKAFSNGDADGLETNARLARLCLNQIEAILSTRPDFSLQAQIDWAMRQPGANPHLPWYMKQHCVNDLYSSNEVYEQLHWFYAPRIEVYLAELERRAAEGTRTIAWTDIAGPCEAIRERWLNEPIAIPVAEHYPGTTIEAVVDAFASIEPHLPSPPERGQETVKNE